MGILGHFKIYSNYLIYLANPSSAQMGDLNKTKIICDYLAPLRCRNMVNYWLADQQLTIFFAP
jgi:hypothetical protein